MSKRPKIQIPLSSTDKIIEMTGWLFLAGLIGFSIYAYTNAPDVIPTHFNASGEADAEGSKSFLLIMPAITIGIFLFLTLIGRAPHTFNYSVEITEENAPYQYGMAVKMVRVIKVLMVVLFLGITFMMYATATGIMNSTPIVIILSLGIIPVIPVIYYSAKMKKSK